MTTIAIDGPAGAGKSTVAQMVAEALGFSYVDTGAMYRAVAVAVLDAGVDPLDGDSVGSVAARIDLGVEGSTVTLDGINVSARIREPDVTAAVSQVSAHPEVRTALVEQQRRLASTQDVVMEGRDIGSAVIPEAEVKVYLTASIDERARRRWEQGGGGEDLDRIRGAIEARDAADETRTVSPLRKATGAITIDTSEMSAQEVVDEIVRLSSERIHA